MAPSEGPGGDPAAEEGPTGVTRSSRSGPTTTRYFGDRPAAATRAGECDADGVEEEEEEAVARRGYYPNPAPRRSTPAAGEGGSRSLGKRVLSGKEAVPRCGCYGDTPPRRPRPFGEGTSAAGAEAAVPRCGCYRDTPPRRPRPFGEGTSAAGAEEAVLTCGCDRDTPPRRLVGANSTRLGHKGGVPRCIPTLVRPGSDPTPCVQNQLASGGGRGQRDSYFNDGTSEPHPHAPTADLPAKIGSETDAAFCIPVVAGGRGDGGGRGDRDGYIYGCTARPHTFMPAPTSDLAPKDKATSQTIECMEEGYLAKIVPANAPEPKAPKANAVQLSNVKSADPDGRVLKADIEDYSASVAKGGKCESFAASGLDCTSFAASGLDCTDIPNAQIRKVTANCLLASKQTIPQYYLTVETRADELIKLRGELNPLQEESGGKKISKDLVIKDADKKRLGTLGEEVKQLAQRARDNSLKPQDYEGGTLTQSNLGCPFGIRQFPAILNPPQSAILAIGSGGHDDKNVMIPTQHDLPVKMDSNGENGEIKGPQPFSDVPDFVCSDRGGCFGKSNYISKMNYYLRADCVRDINPIFDREARSRHSRYEVLKERFCDLAEVPASVSTCASIKSSVDIVTQIFMDICGSTVSLQKDLSKVDINMLSEAAFVRVGIKPSDFYSTYAGKVLEPNRLLSCYHIPRDSTIKLNARLRGGCADRNWDTVIGNLDRYQIVHLAENDLLLLEQIIDPQVEVEVEVKVKYLADLLRVQCRKVLIYLCRKHYSGLSFGGNFSSHQIMFDSDGNVRIDAAPQHYSQPSALLDYNVVSGIFDRALGHAADKDPTHFRHLIRFLSVNGPVVDCQSKAVIAFVTNHISLLTYSERIQHTSVLDLFITRLGADDRAALIKILDPFDWGPRLEKIQAMSETYYFVWWYDDDGVVCVPYKNNGVSLLRFSHNFFKHCTRFPLDELEAAFSLVTADKNFLAHLLFKILIRFKSRCQQPCPASIEAFVDKVIKMLGDHTVDCEMVQVN